MSTLSVTYHPILNIFDHLDILETCLIFCHPQSYVLRITYKLVICMYVCTFLTTFIGYHSAQTPLYQGCTIYNSLSCCGLVSQHLARWRVVPVFGRFILPLLIFSYIRIRHRIAVRVFDTSVSLSSSVALSIGKELVKRSCNIILKSAHTFYQPGAMKEYDVFGAKTLALEYQLFNPFV